MRKIELKRMIQDTQDSLERATKGAILLRNVQIIPVGRSEYNVIMKVVKHENERYTTLAQISFNFNLNKIDSYVIRRNIESALSEILTRNIIIRGSTKCQKVNNNKEPLIT